MPSDDEDQDDAYMRRMKAEGKERNEDVAMDDDDDDEDESGIIHYDLECYLFLSLVVLFVIPILGSGYGHDRLVSSFWNVWNDSHALNGIRLWFTDTTIVSLVSEMYGMTVMPLTVLGFGLRTRPSHSYFSETMDTAIVWQSLLLWMKDVTIIHS